MHAWDWCLHVGLYHAILNWRALNCLNVLVSIFIVLCVRVQSSDYHTSGKFAFEAKSSSLSFSSEVGYALLDVLSGLGHSLVLLVRKASGYSVKAFDMILPGCWHGTLNKAFKSSESHSVKQDCHP